MFTYLTFQHYGNMFQHASRLAKEAEEADRQAHEAQKARLAQEGKDGKKGANPSDAAAMSNSLPQGEPLYEDVGANAPPLDPPSATDLGIKLELPLSMIEKSDEMKSPVTSAATNGAASTQSLTSATLPPPQHLEPKVVRSVERRSMQRNLRRMLNYLLLCFLFLH